jgi:hypothetical protein
MTYYDISSKEGKTSIKLGISLDFGANDSKIYLQKKIKESPYSVEELAKIAGIDKMVIDHFLRDTLWGCAVPENILFKLLNPPLNYDDFKEFMDERERKRFEAGFFTGLAIQRIRKHLGRD